MYAGCCLVGGQVKGPFLISRLFKGDDSHVFHHIFHAGCTHYFPSSQLPSRAFLAIKQDLEILSFSKLWR